MIEANDILSRKSEIEGYIATTGLRAAVGRFIDLSRELGNIANAPLILSGRFHTIDEEDRSNKRTKEEISVAKTKLSDDLLSTLREFVDEALQELLKDKTAHCKQSINKNLEEGYNALLEIAGTFSSEEVEKELLTLKAQSIPLSKEILDN